MTTSEEDTHYNNLLFHCTHKSMIVFFLFRIVTQTIIYVQRKL